MQRLKAFYVHSFPHTFSCNLLNGPWHSDIGHHICYHMLMGSNSIIVSNFIELKKDIPLVYFRYMHRRQRSYETYSGVIHS